MSTAWNKGGLVDFGERRIDLGVVVGGAAGAQEVALARTRFAPEEERGFVAVRRQPAGQGAQSAFIAAGDEIVEAGRGLAEFIMS